MGLVKLILKEEVPGLGDAGEVVEVKPGYARNYLLPKGKAVLATEARVREVEHHKRVIAEKLARERKDLEALRDRLGELELEVAAQAGEGGKLFGSVTSAQIAELLSQRGYEIERRRILLEEPIKQIGDYEVPIRLRSDIIAKVKLTVVAAEG